MQEKGVDFQLAPPDDHQRNPAERAIQTFKNHFIAMLCSTDKNFPMHLWCRLLPQAQITLHLLRMSRLNPRLSAEVHLNGEFDFNRTPMAPPGTRVIVHETPAKRGTWAPHGVDGWSLGTALDHYQCYRCYITKTAGERISLTVEFFPTHCKMPATSSADAARLAAQELVTALTNPTPATPFPTLHHEHITAFRHLATIFQKATGKDGDHGPSPRVPANSQQTAATPPRVEISHRDPTRGRTAPIPSKSPMSDPPSAHLRSESTKHSAPNGLSSTNPTAAPQATQFALMARFPSKAPMAEPSSAHSRAESTEFSASKKIPSNTPTTAPQVPPFSVTLTLTEQTSAHLRSTSPKYHAPNEMPSNPPTMEPQATPCKNQRFTPADRGPKPRKQEKEQPGPTKAPTATPLNMTYHMPTPKAQPVHTVNCIYAMFLGLKKPETGIPSMHMANAVIDPETGKTLEYRHLMERAEYKTQWTQSFANELGRLAQGIGDRVQGTNTMFLIRHDQVPLDRRKDVTYGRIVVDIRPQKAKKERTRLTIGGDRINYPGETSTETSDLTTSKLLINSNISTPGARTRFIPKSSVCPDMR
jgi:hypothetical protein